MEKTDLNKESRIRRQLQAKGYRLQKSRVKKTHIDNMGGYMIIDNTMGQNTVFAGGRYELSLNDVEEYLKDLKLNLHLAPD